MRKQKTAFQAFFLFILVGCPCVISKVDLKSTLSWPSLQARREYLKCFSVFKCLHSMAPSYLLSEFKHAHEIHSYNTRHHDLLRLSLAKTSKYQGSFRINGARVYNALPRNIRQIREINEFKTKPIIPGLPSTFYFICNYNPYI